MGWVQTVSEKDFLCFENNKKHVSMRIESRKNDNEWVIYKTFYSQNEVNHTEEYVAPTFDKMNQIINTLQKEKQPTITQIRELVLQKSKKTEVKVEREFKEYNVEKWKFSVNKDAAINFALVRTSEEVDVDFIMHESYKKQETTIIKEIVSILGFDGMEEVMNINCYYFNKYNTKELEAKQEEESPLDFL